MPWPKADDDRHHRAEGAFNTVPEIDNRQLRELNPVTSADHLREVIEEAKVRRFVEEIRSEKQLLTILAQVQPHLRRDCERQMRPMLVFPGADTSIEGL